MPIDPTLRPWWLEPPPGEAAERATEPTGLSGAEAKARLARFGPNLFRERQDKSLLLQYLTRFKNPLEFYFILGGMVLVYLLIVELAKQGFYRWSATGRRPRRSATRA